MIRKGWGDFWGAVFYFFALGIHTWARFITICQMVHLFFFAFFCINFSVYFTI